MNEGWAPTMIAQQLLEFGYMSSSSQKRQRQWGLREVKVTNTMISHRLTRVS